LDTYIYLLFIRLWVYIRALQTAYAKGELMAEEPQTICDWLEIDLERLSGDDKVNLIREVCAELTVEELREVRSIADELSQDKLEDAKNMVVAEMRTRLSQLGFDFDEVMGTNRRRRRSTLPPKYRSPEGLEWSGRGATPKFIREYEEGGGDREDYRIQEEEVN
jgi:DNA-binding protein H-NS